ncbi:MAG: hypothetical protein ACI884_000691 [Ulvibacter sp.]|jgi:hypothetical protein
MLLNDDIDLVIFSVHWETQLSFEQSYFIIQYILGVNL